MTYNERTSAEILHHLHYLGYISDKEEEVIRKSLNLCINDNIQTKASLGIELGQIVFKFEFRKTIHETG